jgi:hypothetical protein
LAVTWSRTFDAPIALPDGREIETMRQAGEYIAALPAKEQHEQRWRTATECLLSAAERGGIVMMAEIAMRKALGSGRERPEPEPPKKAAKKYRIFR